MTNEPFDRDFRRFRATRDPAALAAVFDAVAPRLLLVAMHLVRDAATAEDLVQSVFLQVLRDVDRFDPQRPVLPWLLGMLEHRASDLRQRAHVRRERADVAVLAAASPMASGPTPANAAALAEVRERVAEAIAGMPADYRTVLTLRLVHGLAPVDIAHAHGLPPATVRTRLRRGLELLRAALPRGWAAPGLTALLAAELLRASDGLATVRAKVLTAAGGTSAVGVGGWLCVLAALLLLIGGGVALSSRNEPAPPSVAPSSTARVAATSSTERTPAALVGAERLTALNLATPDRPADPRTSIVRGRCVDEGGRPLAGVVVAWHVMRAWRTPGPGDDQAEAFQPPAPATTADDGSFTFAFVPPTLREIQLVCTSAHHVTGYVDVGELRHGVVFDAGDVVMPVGTRVRLRLVVGTRPLAATRLVGRRVQDGTRSAELHPPRPSDDDGWIDLGVVLAGTWHRHVETPYLDGDGELVVPAQREPFTATIVLREPPPEHTIAGVLVDSAGLPVRGVELALPLGIGWSVTQSEPDGRFVCSFPPTFTAPADWHLTLWRSSTEFELLDDGGAAAPGRNDVRVVVRRRPRSSLRVAVVDADGEPVTRFGVRCWPDRWRLPPGNGPRTEFTAVPASDHEGGVAELTDLLPGPCFVSVFPEQPFAEAAEIPLDLPEGRATELQVVLRPPAELHVDVVDAVDGGPRSGVMVQLAKVVPSAASSEVDTATWRTEIARVRQGWGWSSGPNVLVLASATSDIDGRVRLRAPANVPGLVLLAGGGACQERVQAGVSLPPEGAHVRLPVVAAGTVRGHLAPAAFVERFGPSPEALALHAQQAEVRHVDAGRFVDDYPSIALRPCGRTDGAPVAVQHVSRDGSFELGGVPPGRYEVWVCVITMYVTTELGPLQTVDVGVEAGPMLHLDASRWLPGRLDLVLECDGAVGAGRGGLLRLAADGSADGQVELDVDPAGRMRSPWLLPGRYLAFLRHGTLPDATAMAIRARTIHADSASVVVAGVEVQQTIALRRRSLAVSVVDASGGPCPNVHLQFVPLDRPELPRHLWPEATTGVDGGVAMPVLPSGRLLVRQLLPGSAGSDEGDTRDLGVVGADATVARLRLP